MLEPICIYRYSWLNCHLPSRPSPRDARKLARLATVVGAKVESESLPPDVGGCVLKQAAQNSERLASLAGWSGGGGEIHFQRHRPSLRDFTDFSPTNPPLKRWAIIRPSLRDLRDGELGPTVETVGYFRGVPPGRSNNRG